MKGDVRYKRYYCGAVALYRFSMLGLVLADNFFLLFIFWELIGLCSFLLIGHWYEKSGRRLAAKKAFLTTRVGDVGMFIGIMLLFFAYPHPSSLTAVAEQPSPRATWPVRPSLSPPS